MIYFIYIILSYYSGNRNNKFSDRDSDSDNDNGDDDDDDDDNNNNNNNDNIFTAANKTFHLASNVLLL